MNGSTKQHSEVMAAAMSTEASEPAPDGLEGLYPMIPGFKGRQYPFSHDQTEFRAYSAVNTLYATSSHGEDHHMRPGLIIQPKDDDDDVMVAIRYADDKWLKISVKSGGHQYSGACSTNEPNIMMDLGSTYQEFDPVDKATSILKIGVSNSLKVVNEKLHDEHLFVPHGQCSHVHLGGHGQTGGYGNLGRSFGLFGDYIRKIRLYDHSATAKEISLDSRDEFDRQLFSAILGGSPGNFGVITHYYVQVYRDEDYMFDNDGTQIRPQFYRGFHLYRRDILEKCLKKVAEMADNPEFERNYDLCMSVLSSNSRLKTSDVSENLEEVSTEAPQAREDDGVVIDGNEKWPAVIVIYAQWVPFSKDDKFDPAWFNYFTHLPWKIPRWREKGSFRGTGPMSGVTGLWLFIWEREFALPYDKRTYLITSTSLEKASWVTTVTDQTDMVVSKRSKDQDLHKNCYLAVQIQCFGGKKSKFTTNQGNGTSYSWRDTTVVQVLDCFYNNVDKGKALARKWQAENDNIMKGKGSVFGEQDRRVLWGSYGDWGHEEELAILLRE